MKNLCTMHKFNVGDLCLIDSSATGLDDICIFLITEIKEIQDETKGHKIYLKQLNKFPHLTWTAMQCELIPLTTSD